MAKGKRRSRSRRGSPEPAHSGGGPPGDGRPGAASRAHAPGGVGPAGGRGLWRPGRRRRANLLVVGGVALLVLGAVLAAYLRTVPSSTGAVEVRVPELSAQAERGRRAFEANCGNCHGENAAGTDHGPPLVHDIYNPGHHADSAFVRATQRGVPRHHWRFGDMPPQPQVSRREVDAIVRYVRELQRANGIVTRAHSM